MFLFLILSIYLKEPVIYETLEAEATFVQNENVTMTWTIIACFVGLYSQLFVKISSTFSGAAHVFLYEKTEKLKRYSK